MPQLPDKQLEPKETQALSSSIVKRKSSSGIADNNINRNEPREPKEEVANYGKKSPSEARKVTGGPLNGAQKPSPTVPSQGGRPASPMVKPSANAPAAAKVIDSDLLNVANENRVILNVGGIRHETYKVGDLHLLGIFYSIYLLHLEESSNSQAFGCFPSV